MKKIILVFCLLMSFIILSDKIEDNKNKIKQIENEISKNRGKISKNNQEISQVQKNRNVTQAELNKITKQVDQLQKNYVEAQNAYKNILLQIGQDEAEINRKIQEINANSEIINVNKADLNERLVTWRRVQNLQKIDKTSFVDGNLASQEKRAHDFKKVLDTKSSFIRSVEEVKTGIENEKNVTEAEKRKKEAEAAQVAAARANLEDKKRSLDVAVKEKNRIISALKSKQSTLNSENKKIENTNSSLSKQRRQLEVEIQSIITAELERQKRIAEQKERERQAKIQAEAEAARKKAEAEAAKNAELSTQEIKDKGTQAAKETTQTLEREIPKQQTVKGTGNMSYPISGSVVVSYKQEKVPGVTSNGVEFRSSVGATVKAADSGTVLYAGSLRNLGQVVIINHGNLTSVYGNLQGVNVSKGSSVSKGQSIGSLGRDSDGNANLYFEVRSGASTVNPMSYL